MFVLGMLCNIFSTLVFKILAFSVRMPNRNGPWPDFPVSANALASADLERQINL